MTPLQALLTTLVLVIICLIIDDKNDEKWHNKVAPIGGLSLGLFFTSLIWCIFYYIKI